MKLRGGELGQGSPHRPLSRSSLHEQKEDEAFGKEKEIRDFGMVYGNYVCRFCHLRSFAGGIPIRFPQLASMVQ